MIRDRPMGTTRAIGKQKSFLKPGWSFGLFNQENTLKTSNSLKKVSPLLKLIAMGLFLAVLSVAADAQASSTPPCENLSKLKLADTTITSAELVAPGAFAAPAG